MQIALLIFLTVFLFFLPFLSTSCFYFWFYTIFFITPNDVPLTFSELLKDVDLKDKAKAYVLIETDPALIPNILEELAKVENVRSADVVTGIYDIIVFLEGENQNEIGRIVIKEINPIRGVKKATTCTVVEI